MLLALMSFRFCFDAGWFFRWSDEEKILGSDISEGKDDRSKGDWFQWVIDNYIDMYIPFFYLNEKVQDNGKGLCKDQILQLFLGGPLAFIFFCFFRISGIFCLKCIFWRRCLVFQMEYAPKKVFNLSSLIIWCILRGCVCFRRQRKWAGSTPRRPASLSCLCMRVIKLRCWLLWILKWKRDAFSG